MRPLEPGRCLPVQNPDCFPGGTIRILTKYFWRSFYSGKLLTSKLRPYTGSFLKSIPGRVSLRQQKSRSSEGCSGR